MLAAPFFFVLVFGLIGGGWLFFMNEAVNDAARSAAREAAIKDPLVTTQTVGGQPYLCESSEPVDPTSIESAAQRAASIIPVNPGELCQYNASSQTLTQPASGSSAATIQVAATGTLQAAIGVTASVTYTSKLPLPLFSPSITFHAASTLTTQCSGTC